MTIIEWVQFSVLIVAIGLSITLSIVVLLKSIREGFTRKRTATFVLALGLLFIVYLAYNAQEIHPADMVQIMLVIGLVAVTGVYALFTARQADASVKMADEMREQRLDEARPYLLIRLKDESVSVNLTLGHPVNFTVTILNAGKGPAIDLLAALWYPNRNPFFASKGYLVSGKEWEAVISGFYPVGAQPEKGKEGWLPELSELVKRPQPGVVAVKYKDIHKQRKWVSYLCLESPVNDASIAIEGEQNIVELKKDD